MKQFIVVLLSIFSFHLTYSQQAGLDAIINDIASNIHEVSGKKSTYKQSLSSPKSCVIRYEYDEVDSKGNTSKNAFEFNLADIDPYAVRETTKSDLILVALTAVNKQKLVKTYNDGEVGSYTDEVEIIAKDVDNARKLVELIKKAIPLAKQITENKLQLSSYQDMVQWLTQNVKEVNVNEETYKQQISKGQYPGTLVFSKITVDRSSINEEFTFNLADINVNSLRFEISGNKFGVNFETLGKKDVIQHKENQEEKPFVSEVTIVTGDVEGARNIRNVLAMAIPEAEKIVSKDLPTLDNKTKALSEAVKYVTTVTYGDTEISQTFEPTCITKIEQVEKSPKSTIKQEYELNLMDINANVLDYDVSREKMYVELVTTDKTQLIRSSKDGQFDGYEDDLKIYTQDVEVARRLRHALKSAVKFCAADYKVPYSTKTTEIIKWIMANVSEVIIDGTTYKQQLEFVDPSDVNKVKFTKNTIDSKKSVEEVYEFNFSDLNPKSIVYDIGGKNLKVTVETNHKNKIIKYYKDGQIQNYAYGLEFVFTDVERARNFKSALAKVVTDLSK